MPLTAQSSRGSAVFPLHTSSLIRDAAVSGEGEASWITKHAAVNPKSWRKTEIYTLVLRLETSPAAFQLCSTTPASWPLFARL